MTPPSTRSMPIAIRGVIRGVRRRYTLYVAADKAETSAQVSMARTPAKAEARLGDAGTLRKSLPNRPPAFAGVRWSAGAVRYFRKGHN